MNFFQNILRKITSRKFIAAGTLVVAGLIAMFTETPTDAAQQQVESWSKYIPNVIGAITAILGALGFIKAEADVDAAREITIVEKSSED